MTKTRKYDVTEDHELVCTQCWEVIGMDHEVFEVVPAHYLVEHPEMTK